MYSDMSMRTIASSPNRNSASVRASSVFPTPEGPRKMNEPVGRLGSFSPARERRIAFETASMAASRPITRLWSSSMRISFCVSASVSLNTGMPVHMETMSAISSSPISGRSPDSPERHCSSSSRFCCELALLVAQVHGLELLRLDRRLFRAVGGLDVLLEVLVHGGAVIDLMRARDAASSMRSIALSGRKRSEM